MRFMGKKDSHQAIQAREAFETIISQEEPRDFLCKLLDKIQEKTHSEGRETEWAFNPESLSKEMPGVDLGKLNYMLQFLFNIKYINVSYPLLNKPINSQEYAALPHRFSPLKVEDTKRKFEILSQQRKLRDYIQRHIPDNNTLLNEKQIKENESTLFYLKGLHEKTNQRRTWEETIVTYFMLKSKMKRNPTENEVSEVLGLLDYRVIRGRKKLPKEVEEYNLKLEFSDNEEVRNRRIKNAYEELKKQGIIPTPQRIAKKVGLGDHQVRRYIKTLKLEVVSGVKAPHLENVKRVKQAYEKIKNELLPTKKEIIQETKLSESAVKKVCKECDLKLLKDTEIGVRIIHQYIKDLIKSGRNISEITIPDLQDYIDNKGKHFCYNTIQKWRAVLEDAKLIPKSKYREEWGRPPKYLKYREAYLKLVKAKMKNKEKIVLKRIAEELSREFGEEVPGQRTYALRDTTGIPVLLDNEARYKNIVKIYEKHPEIQMEDWAEESKVSIGFLYDALRQFKKHPGVRKKFDVPDEMLSRLKTKENPMVKAFRAIGNTNRVKILKCLIEEDDTTLDEILERVGYENKWRDTFEYHLEVLEDAGIVSLSYYNNNINLTSLGEDISSHIKAWDINGIVPEDIFGPGYNKPLFALAISGGDIKALKEIVKFMREVKGYTPIDVPSENAKERYPVDKHWGKKFKQYLNNFLGKYQIKEEHLQFLGPLILNVRDFFSTSHISIPHLCKIKEVEYGRVRDITLALVDRGHIDEFYLQVPQEQALKYMNFIKDNFYAICERIKLKVPQKNMKLEYDRSNEIYSLSLC